MGTKIKLKPSDVWFSKCKRESQDYTCERCGAEHERSSKGIHNSHIFSRRHRTIRWCAENTQCLCYACHSWYGGNPADSGVWISEFLGESVLELLRTKRGLRKRRSPNTTAKNMRNYWRGAQAGKLVFSRLSLGNDDDCDLKCGDNGEQ